jgi:hypothetical protein
MVQWPGRQGVGSCVGEDQVIDICILYERMAVMPFAIEDKDKANEGREDEKRSN